MAGGILYILLAGHKLLPNKDSSNEFINKEMDYSNVPAWKQYLSLIILVIAVLGMVFEDSIGIPLYITSTVGAVILVLAKVVSEKEAVQSFEITAVFLVAFMLPLATALEKTSTGELIANTLITYVGNGSSIVLTGTLWLVAAVLTQFMSNTATAALLAPIGTSIAATLGADPRAVLMAIFIGSSCAFMTPVAMPCSTMVLQPGNAIWNNSGKFMIRII
ncbi:SLC13 family permease [Lacrimispora indolis]|uniref:SLC13 family permease n=1 Tax=Lacrimispora indolis TaxID=69825 RepID=UPI00041BF10B|nr:SLC13 family permease [[Clostridium] methoxybenzovorans]